ncbi:isocitrate lyase/phosphoenolpyruvate mutase family protein [Bradyrhizobium sp. UFLA05-112]
MKARRSRLRKFGMQYRSVRENGPDRGVRTLPADILRPQVCSNDDLSFLMDAHDGLPGAIAQRAGFKGLWASGSLGYRDANEASWSQLVEVVERIVGSTELLVLVDGDSGFGNLNNARLLARRVGSRIGVSVSTQKRLLHWTTGN